MTNDEFMNWLSICAIVGGIAWLIWLSIRHSSFVIRHSKPIILPTLLIEPPMEQKRLESELRTHLRNPGVQALIQILESNAADALASSIQQNLSRDDERFHAGEASFGLEVLKELQKLK